MRVGLGYDAHRLVPERKLILGGVCIPHHLGLLGHSDADVLTHAVMDAILGAAGQGDIGRHFPDTDERYRGADSIALLSVVNQIINSCGYSVVNIDSVIVAQAPKLLPYIPKMVSNIANALEIAPGFVNVKATTDEGMGFTGSLEGICAKAICLLEGERSCH